MQAQLSITQALPQLKRTRLIAYKNIKNGKLPATLTIIDGRAAYLINQDDLSKFIAERDSKKNKRT